MDEAFAGVIEKCRAALGAENPQSAIQPVILEAAHDPAILEAISKRTKFTGLADLVIHRSDSLTLLAGSLPPGFRAAPHNHNLWSVVGVCAGQEDNEFFERTADGLEQIGKATVVAPGVLANAADAIHAIHNPLDVPLLVLHAYGGDLLRTARSSWNPDTHEEIPFDWEKVRPAKDVVD